MIRGDVRNNQDNVFTSANLFATMFLIQVCTRLNRNIAIIFLMWQQKPDSQSIGPILRSVRGSVRDTIHIALRLYRDGVLLQVYK